MDQSTEKTKAKDGLGMLLHQAREGFEAWFDQKVEVDQDLRNRILAA